jgi:hypothetical protein
MRHHSDRRRALLVGGLATIGLLVAACSSGSGSPGVASLSSSNGSGAAPSSGSTTGSAIAYSQCMRAHGVKDFPDPNSNGEIQIEAHPGSDLAPDSPVFKAAQQACKSLEPTGSPEQQAQARASMLKFSQCMRDHGIKDFPDPSADGRMQISASPGGDLDPNSAQFKAAQQACQKYQPKGKGGADGPSTNKGTGS